MKKHKTIQFDNPFDIFTEEIIFSILDYLNDDPFAKSSFSLVCKSFYFTESRHRTALKPLRSDLLSRTFHRYRSIAHLDLSLCPLVDDCALTAFSLSWKSTLRSINLSRSKSFTSIGLSSLVTNCSGLVDIDLSNGTELTDSAAKAIAEAKSLERLWLASCKSITDSGIGSIALGCRKLRSICLRRCLRVTDLGVALMAMKCKQIRSFDLSYLPITNKCLPHILKLSHLEDLVLEGCLGIDDDCLATLKHGCKSIKMINMSRCQNVSQVGLSSLTNGAESLQQLILAYGPAVTADLAECLHSFSGLRSIKLDGCSVTCSGIRAIGNWHASLIELSLSNITSSCTLLTSLRMESCSSVSKDAFVFIGQRCQLLEELDVTDNEIDNEGLKAISSCSKLCSLKLGICVNITDDGLTHVGNGCLKLKELDLYRSPGISDMGIAAIARGCPALEMINIAYNNKITDLSLTSLSKCSSLKVLEIRGCPCVSSAGLSAIAMGCRQIAKASFRQGNPSSQEAAAPTNILFIENLPHETASMMLELLFPQYPGFKEVRMIEAKPGIAFVEFEDDVQSSMAMQALQGFKITPQKTMTITFAKK